MTATAVTTGTATATRTQVATHFADKMLLLLGNIIRDSGLDMADFTSRRAEIEKGIKSWIISGHLRKVTLEIFKPGTKSLIRRWDLDWDKCDAAESGFWVDVADIRYHLKKNGVIAKDCLYGFLFDCKPGYRPLPGWTTGTYADTTGLKLRSLGTTITAGSYGSRTSYWS
jgi:hypothetical protein